MEIALALREADLIPKVEDYFASRGWRVSVGSKVRGRIVDVIAMKGDRILAVEVKTTTRGIERGLESALHEKNAVGASYLAIPSELVTLRIKETCRNLGIGLLSVDKDDVREAVGAARDGSMPSVRETILGGKDSRKKENYYPVIEISGSLGRLFRSNAQVLILKLLLLNSMSEFHSNDIARRTRLAPSTVVKEVRVLAELSLVKVRKQGSLKLVSISKESPIFEELRRIFLKFEMLDEIIRRALPSEIDYALIYGSFAKGKEEVSSDIDLLVVGDLDEDKLLKRISQAERDIGREINYNLWSRQEFLEKARSKIPLLNEILKTPVIMISGDGSEFNRIIRQGSG